jgi:hypothetical protein
MILKAISKLPDIILTQSMEGALSRNFRREGNKYIPRSAVIVTFARLKRVVRP